MSAGQIDLALLQAARLEFVEKILPGLTGPERYTGAMLKRSLDILLAQASADTTPADVLRAKGFGTARDLAAALRSGQEPPTEKLCLALRHYVEAKLQITNPGFLAATRSRRSSAGT